MWQKTLRTLLFPALLPVLFGGCIYSPDRPSHAIQEPPQFVEGATATLRVRILDVFDDTGEIKAGLFSNADVWLTKDGVSHGASVAPETGSDSVVLIFESIPVGVYGLSVFHDVDGSRKFNRSAFGIPDEPWGISNDAGGGFGPPKFHAAAFALHTPETTIELHLRRGLGLNPVPRQDTTTNE